MNLAVHLRRKKDVVRELGEAAPPPPAMSEPSQGQKPVFSMAPDEEPLLLFCLIWSVLASGQLLSCFILSFSSPSALPQAMVQQDMEPHVSKPLLGDLLHL